MGKYILTMLLALFLLAPQMDLGASGRHYSQHNRWLKSIGLPHATKDKLESLSDSIQEINARIDALNLTAGVLPEDLAAALAPLQASIDVLGLQIGELSEALAALRTDIDTNTGDMSLANTAIEDLLNEIEIINDDISKLADAPESDLIFAGSFIGGESVRFGIKVDWVNFTRNATGSFSSIEIRNTLGGSVQCSDSGVVNDIIKELHTHVPVEDSIESFDCIEPRTSQLVKWNIGFCGNEMELNAGLIKEVCECGRGAVVRPLHPSENWGGVGTEFGGKIGGDTSTCGAPSQTLEVILTR